jgi:hypothetical protein
MYDPGLVVFVILDFVFGIFLVVVTWILRFLVPACPGYD